MIRLISRITGPARYDTTLTLPYEERVKSRLRVVLDNGREAGLFLDRGTILGEGDILQSEQGYRVLVKAAAEPVSTARSGLPSRIARACYHLGNRHVAVEIAEGRVRYRPDRVLDRMVEHLGLAVSREEVPFAPETGAYHGHGDHE